MSQPIIEVRNLSKRYQLGAIGATSLREEASRLWDRLRGVPHPDAREFWALRDISFDIQPGEVVGVIGRNGAGKSTLLKVLSRITEPTSGTAKLRGRVASLLEVGTGFHPELTGRENVFLNGAILGMTRAEVRRKFEEIVAFAEVEQFIDTPVKRYSSGMYVRLAFAVAAHLEPEILIIDEVLAVGDAAFQKKCLGKIKDVSSHDGRTVFFVSHTMAAVSGLCTRALLLNKGCLELDGSPDQIISRYISTNTGQNGEISWPRPDEAPGNDRVRLHAVRITSGGSVTGDVEIDRDINVQIYFWNLTADLRLSVSIHLLDKVGVEVLATANLPSANLVHDAWFGRAFPLGLFRSTCTIPGNFLNEGTYSIRVILCSDVNRFELATAEVVSFVVHDSGEMRKEYSGHWLGVVRPKLAWSTLPIDATAVTPPSTSSP